MNYRTKHPSSTQSPDVLTGKPTIGPNTGVSIESKLLTGFQPAKGSTPEWVRLPKPRTRCTYSGLARTTLIELIERREVRGISLRKPGTIRGIRLLNLPSMYAYFDRLDREQNCLSGNSAHEGEPAEA